MANSTKATAGKTNNAKIARSFVFLFFNPIPSRNSIFLWFILGKQANLLPVSLFCQLHSVSPKSTNLFLFGSWSSLLFCRCPEILEKLCYFICAHISKHVGLEIRTTLICVAARSNCVDPAVCLSSIDIGLSIICKSAGYFHIRLCTRNSAYTFCHPFLAFFGGKDKLTILFCKIQILGIFVYNISPVTGGYWMEKLSA